MKVLLCSQRARAQCTAVVTACPDGSHLPPGVVVHNCTTGTNSSKSGWIALRTCASTKSGTARSRHTHATRGSYVAWNSSTQACKRGLIASIIHCTRFPVPTDVAGVTSDADDLLRPGCGGGRSRASGLFIQGHGAPLPLQLLARREAGYSRCSSSIERLRSTRSILNLFRPYVSGRDRETKRAALPREQSPPQDYQNVG